LVALAVAPARGREGSGVAMIASLVNLLIVVIVCGLLILGLIWVIENIFKIVIPLIVKQACGIIALLLIGLYLLRVFGVA
jgi:hypothetical protein